MSDEKTLGNRIDALEAKLMFQDETIETLNKTITEQWLKIDALTRQLVNLNERLQEAEPSSVDAPSGRPLPGGGEKSWASARAVEGGHALSGLRGGVVQEGRRRVLPRLRRRLLQDRQGARLATRHTPTARLQAGHLSTPTARPQAGYPPHSSRIGHT